MLKLISKKNNMSKSYSKIRHIQESNSRLEKRFLNETTDFDIKGQQTDDLLDNAQRELDSLGYSNIKFDDYVIDDENVCIPETNNQKYNSILDKVAEWSKSQTDINVLRTKAKELVSLLKKPVSEQVEASQTNDGLKISGTLVVPPLVLGIIGASILIILVCDIVRLLTGGGGQRSSGGKRSSGGGRRHRIPNGTPGRSCKKSHRFGKTNNPHRDYLFN